MSSLSNLVCRECGQIYSLDFNGLRCEKCEGILMVSHPEIIRREKKEVKDICLRCILVNQGRVHCQECMMRRLLVQAEKGAKS